MGFFTYFVIFLFFLCFLSHLSTTVFLTLQPFKPKAVFLLFFSISVFICCHWPIPAEIVNYLVVGLCLKGISPNCAAEQITYRERKGVIFQSIIWRNRQPLISATIEYPMNCHWFSSMCWYS